jgi:hypothetical protein
VSVSSLDASLVASPLGCVALASLPVDASWATVASALALAAASLAPSAPASLTAGAHFPFAQSPERHSDEASPHASPSPLPHSLSLSQTPAAHSAARSHALPFASGALHAPVGISQYCPGQSVSPKHPTHFCDVVSQCPLAHDAPDVHGPSPLATPHLPLLPQIPERHTVDPSTDVHGPSPFTRPHLPSAGSHAPLRHTLPAPQPSPFVSPHVPSPSQTPDTHCDGRVHGAPPGCAPFAAAAWQVWLAASQ